MTNVVAVYETEQAYGGPEEGGWWYPTGTRADAIKPIVCATACDVPAAIESLRAKIAAERMNEGRHPPSSVLCTGWFDVEVFPGSEAPQGFPGRKPRYE